MKYWLTTMDALILGALMAAPQMATSAQPGQLMASGGRVNPTAPGQTVTAGYLTLQNSSNKVETVVGASSPMARSIEIHNVSINNGIAQMRRLESLALPSGSVVRFAPGGYHLMIHGLRTRIAAGQTFPVKLHFASGRTIDVPMQVANANGDKKPGNSSHAHH